jgi:hypothetical protein
MRYVATEIERHLGKAVREHAVSLGEIGSVIIEEYRDTPCRGATTFASVSLNEFLPFRQELVFGCYSRQVSEDVVLLVAAVAQYCIERTLHLHRGDIIGPFGPIIDGSPMEAFYLCPPVYFSEGLEKIHVRDIVIEVIWIVPIYTSEVEWINNHGWDGFETLLEEKDPDLLDLSRPSLCS